ncbi:MAG: 3,4-dihydroxy-2-butanone-4-phosphate synthase, partial [Brevundimonas sp.]
MMQLAANDMNDSPISPIEDILEDARNGKPYILVDAEDRENEGDIIIPAQFATPDQINFMIRQARGLVCLAMTADRARPLVARDGGVLVRAGHTEASVDISRMAGLTPAAVICEIIKDDGEMARMPDLVAFAQLHGLKIGTIADLIAYRRRTERFVERVMDTPFESVHGGPFRLMLYRNTIEGAEHVAFVHGKIEPGKPTLVRMHQVDFAADLLGHVEARQGYIPSALRGISNHDGAGVTVFLRDPDLQ